MLQVAAHEVGHSLGLEHTSKRGALMSPFYDNFAAEKAINPDDIVSIQNLYGWCYISVCSRYSFILIFLRLKD